MNRKKNEKLSWKTLVSSKIILTEDGNPARYHLQKSTDNMDQSKPYRKITFGDRDRKKLHKIILMVGETGSGKTALINTMINYILGVQREDKVWIEITDDQSDRSSAHSQTSDVTVYGVYIQETSVDLTIIDTPGYGHTRDINLDKEMVMQVHSLTKSADGVHEINAVCFVIKADQNRLSDRQHYIFDAVQSLFGKDIADNIVLLFTHSTGARPKNALTAVKEAKVKCAVDEKKNQPIYFLFNNCQEETFDEKEQTIQDQAWDLSFRGMEGFFNFLDKTQPKTLSETQEVLQNRKQFEKKISNIKSHVESIEVKQKRLKLDQEALEKQKQLVEAKGNFEQRVEVSYKERVNIDPAVAKQAMCCTFCKENCHYPGCWWVENLSWCSVMKDNHCLVCTNKCHYTKHIKEAKIYVTKTRVEINTNRTLKREFENRVQESLSLVNKQKEELEKLEKEKIKLVNEAFDCVESLEMIALNTESLSILQHIDFFIERLKEINQPDKAEALENIKKRAGENKKQACAYMDKNKQK